MDTYKDARSIEFLLELMERKNLCFRSFYKLCEGFIDEIAKGETQNLEEFQRRRQGLIKVLEQLEFEITHWLEGFKDTPDLLDALITSESRTKMNYLLRDKDVIVKSILDLDLQILGHIDRIKDDTIKKLQSLQTGRKTIGAYRSPMEAVEAAELAKTLDREA